MTLFNAKQNALLKIKSIKLNENTLNALSRLNIFTGATVVLIKTNLLKSAQIVLAGTKRVVLSKSVSQNVICEYV